MRTAVIITAAIVVLLSWAFLWALCRAADIDREETS